MTKNPIVNALGAILYIVVVASAMFYGPTLINLPKEDSVFMPIGFLSLFVFSAAVMGYIFLGQPTQMFLSGEKKQAVDLFIKTLVVFGITVLLVVGGGIFLTSSTF